MANDRMVMASLMACHYLCLSAVSAGHKIKKVLQCGVEPRVTAKFYENCLHYKHRFTMRTTVPMKSTDYPDYLEISPGPQSKPSAFLFASR